MKKIFTRIESIEVPASVPADPSNGKNAEFTISFGADGEIPFPQVIVRGRGMCGGIERIFRNESVRRDQDRFSIHVQAGTLPPGGYSVQIEGARKPLEEAEPGDWIKAFGDLRVEALPIEKAIERIAGGAAAHRADGVKIHFGIHKHMHQPYYNAVDPMYWDGEKDGIFASRGGPYNHYIPTAVRQYIEGGLPHAGLSTSWSGSLIEQLNRCARDGLCGGAFTHWRNGLREFAGTRTKLGNPRIEFSVFGFFHPLMALIPGRDIKKQIAWHRQAIRDTFGQDTVDASGVLFPPETAFHVRMIPALLESGVKAVIYDSIHRFRSCKDYPYAGMPEGMLPPNASEQENEAVHDWFQLQNVWAGSKISPSLLKPEYVKYEDPEGREYKIIAIPAERYLGNEDARGGFGALQYPSVIGQLLEQITAHGSFDPKHPPFFILHSDGDNYGGGAESYYGSNTGQLVEWLKQDPRFELTTISDYLERFPPDPSRAIHLEPGAWSGADNGDPQFRKWFSRYDQPYSPDLNSWAVLTALQNAVHSLEDAIPEARELGAASRLMLTAETSCYWYWTGQEVWDSQVTQAANAAHRIIKSGVDSILSGGAESTGPTIFAPWITPENPGGRTWGNNCLKDAEKQGHVHTFVYDISGLKRVNLIVYPKESGKSAARTLAMVDHGPYPCHTGASVTSNYFTCEMPVGMGDVRYYIEAEDLKGNVSRSALERVFLA